MFLVLRHGEQVAGNALIRSQKSHGVHVVGQHPHRPSQHSCDGQEDLRVLPHLLLQGGAVDDHDLTAGDGDGGGDPGEFVKERRFAEDVACLVDSQDLFTAVLRVDEHLHATGFQVVEPVGGGALQVDELAGGEGDGVMVGLKGRPAVFRQTQFLDAEIPHVFPSILY